MNLSSGKIILFILHGALLVPMFFDDSDDLFAIVFASFTLILTFLGNLKTELQQTTISSLIPLLLILGGISTYYLSVELKLGAVIAASLIGFLASFIPSIVKSPQATQAPSAIYCGTFTGMCTPMVAPDYTFVLLACMFSGGIYLLVKNELNGIGGKLGTVAFGGVLILTLLIQFMK